MAKMKTNEPQRETDWLKILDAGFDAGTRRAVTAVNFLLQQLVTRTAAKLDVGESRVRLDFGRRRNDNSFAWTATLYTSRDAASGVVHEGVAQDPMGAVAALVEEVECSD